MTDSQIGPQTALGSGDAGGSGRRHKPRRRSRLARNQVVIFFNLLLSGAVLGLLTVGAVLYWGKSQFEGQGPLREEATYVVPRNSGWSSAAAGLESHGIISSAEVFEYGVRLAGKGTALKPGEYGFAPGVSMREVMDTLASGKSIMYSVSVPEGWTVQQIYDRLAANEVLTGDLPALKPEGTLRPDTYRVQRGTTRAELIEQMEEAQNKLVQEVWAKRSPDLPVDDIGQFLTLASIVERETGVDSERPHVASVFVNRLREGMRLQSDPTFLYGIYGGRGKPSDKPITQSDIESDTPYNTYRVRGLPPGPIANPGRAALEATANPLDTDDRYFVADGTGGHAFASSLEEHNRNVRRYREWERSQAAQATEPAGGTGAAEAVVE